MFSAIAIVLAACVACGLSLHVGHQIGGKRSIDMPPNQEVKDAASFGASEKYGNLHPTANVISGTQQVVSGLSYDLKVAVTRKTTLDSSNTECTVDKMVVGFQPWKTPKYTLYSFERTAEACP